MPAGTRVPPGVTGDGFNLASVGRRLGVAGLGLLVLGGDPLGLGGTQVDSPILSICSRTRGKWRRCRAER